MQHRNCPPAIELLKKPLAAGTAQSSKFRLRNDTKAAHRVPWNSCAACMHGGTDESVIAAPTCRSPHPGTVHSWTHGGRSLTVPAAAAAATHPVPHTAANGRSGLRLRLLRLLLWLLLQLLERRRLRGQGSKPVRHAEAGRQACVCTAATLMRARTVMLRGGHRQREPAEHAPHSRVSAADGKHGGL